MKHWLLTASISLAALATLVCVPNARADTWNKKTELTFSQPVEIPGKVLPAGSYVFKLADSIDRNIVLVYNKDESKFYGMVMAIPDYRPVPKDRTVITFAERPRGAPEAIKTWFYPGENYGEEFVYPKTRAVQLAQETNQNVLATPSEASANVATEPKTTNAPAVEAIKKAPVVAVNPKGEQVEVAQAAIPKPSAAEQQPVTVAQAAPAPSSSAQPAASAPQSRNELPKTASDLPVIFLAGLFSLAMWLTLRMASKRMASKRLS
jgi:hypothetical protein